LDTTFATDLVTNALSSSLSGKLSTSSFNSYTASAINGTISGSSQLTSSYDTRYVISGSITQTTWDNIANKPAGIVSQSTDLSSLNTFTASISTASLVNRLNAIENVSGSWITESETGSFLTSLSGAISSSTQISDLGFVTGSYTTINSFNSLTQSFNSISQSFNVISGSVGTVDFNGVVSGSSQLTSSFDTRYTLSGSVQPLPSNLLSSSAQITAFGFISSSTTIPAGTISGSAQLPTGIISGSSQLDGTTITNLTVTNLTTVNQTSSVLFTSGSNQLGDELADIQTLSGSVRVQGSLTINGTSVSTQSFVDVSALNSATSSYLTSLSGAISSSSQLTSSFDTRYVASGSISSVPAGTISGSSQLTSSYDGRYTQTGSFNTYTSSMNTWTSSLSAIGTLNVDYINAGRRTSDQTSAGNGSDIIFNSSIVSSGISLNTSTGVFTLTAGKTYKLFAELSFSIFSSNVGFIIYDWVDATTNTRLDTSGVSAGIGEAINRDTNEFNATSTTLIYTPTTNQNVKVRIVDALGTATIRADIGTKAIIEQINPSVALNQFATLQISGSLTTTGSITSLGGITGSIRATNGVISGSSQLTSSFDTRYAISASFVSSSNLSSIQTITSASYAALTPVSGTLYIIIG
jgi:hypothetical protein